MHPSQISQIHRATGDALENSISCLETKNVMLKEQIKELEETLMPLPLFSTPLEMVVPTTPTEKLKGSTSLLTLTRGYVEKNIRKRRELITKAWEMSKNMVSFGTREHAFHEYLQIDLKNEQGFYLDAVLPFGVKVTGMTEFRRRHDELPSLDRIDQLNACWKEKVKNMNCIIQECSHTISRRDKLFKKLTEIDLATNTNEVQDQKLIFNSLFLTKQSFDDQVHIYKRLSFENFYGILEYGEDDV
jgi:hypothetical protein